MLQKLLSISEYISPILHLSQVVIILVTHCTAFVHCFNPAEFKGFWRSEGDSITHSEMVGSGSLVLLYCLVLFFTLNVLILSLFLLKHQQDAHWCRYSKCRQLHFCHTCLFQAVPYYANMAMNAVTALELLSKQDLGGQYPWYLLQKSNLSTTKTSNRGRQKNKRKKKTYWRIKKKSIKLLFSFAVLSL